MLDRFTSTITVAIAATAVGVTISVSITGTLAQAPVASVTAPVPALKLPGVNQTCRAFGPTNLTRPCSAPPSMRTKNFSLRRNALN